jgi:TolB protein
MALPQWTGAVLLIAAVLVARLSSQAPASCNDQWPQWSPDGRSIVFTSDRTGDPEIFVLDLAARTPRQLTRTPGRDAHPSFSPDGQLIAFQSPRGDGHTNLYTMRADGSDQRRITSHAGFAGVPVWSHDGKTIAYQWTPRLQAEKWRLMLLDVASGRTEQISDGTANDQVPNWTGDHRLIFYSDRTGRDQLYVRSRDGVMRLTSNGFNDRGATWSRDGRLISFMSDRAGSPAAIFVMNADGSGARRLGTIAPEHGVPFFSPDGRRVLATPTVGGGRQIWSLDVQDGTHQVLSTCGRSAADPISGAR